MVVRTGREEKELCESLIQGHDVWFSLLLLPLGTYRYIDIYFLKSELI